MRLIDADEVLNSPARVKGLIGGKYFFEGVPDELEVHFGSDTEEAYEIVLSMARRVKYELPNGQRFADTGETGVDYFEIYGNAVVEDGFEEDE